MDLFNDIFTDRRDLANFLGDNDCRDSDSISLSSVFKTLIKSLIGPIQKRLSDWPVSMLIF